MAAEAKVEAAKKMKTVAAVALLRQVEAADRAVKVSRKAWVEAAVEAKGAKVEAAKLNEDSGRSGTSETGGSSRQGGQGEQEGIGGGSRGGQGSQGGQGGRD